MKASPILLPNSFAGFNRIYGIISQLFPSLNEKRHMPKRAS
jgi:hypothetical protein